MRGTLVPAGIAPGRAGRRHNSVFLAHLGSVVSYTLKRCQVSAKQRLHKADNGMRALQAAKGSKGGFGVLPAGLQPGFQSPSNKEPLGR